MGTNYYIRQNICEHCNRHDENHLGKSSGGWDFTIHHIEEKFNSWDEFKGYIQKGKIFDEYGEEISYDDFIKLIDTKKEKHPFAHREKYNPYGKYIDGYYFMQREFS